jgi:two-component system response regulator HydG
LLKQRTFDAVILDLRMPGLGGLELISRTANVRTPPIPFVLTAVGDEALANEAAKAGARDFFTKPADLSVIHFALEYAFANR